MALLRQSIIYSVVEVQMLFRGIRSPTQQHKEERSQTGKGGKSGKNFPE